MDERGAEPSEGKTVFGHIPASTGAPLRTTAVSGAMRTTGAN